MASPAADPTGSFYEDRRYSAGVRIPTLLLPAFLLLGCRGPRLVQGPVPTPPPPYRTALGRSVEGRPLELIVLGRGPDTTLVLAALHGDEPDGTPLVRRLAAHLMSNPVLLEGRRVVLVPAANPDGLARGRRRNARGVDLNRDFPARNARPARHGRQPESRLVKALVEIYRPDRILSVHAPLACVDYDGPAQGLAERIAAASRLPVRKLGARPGSLGSWAGVDRSIPVVTLELSADTTRMDEEGLWARYGDAMVAALGP